MAPEAPQLIVQVRQVQFRPDSAGLVTVTAELVNVGSAAAFTSYCAYGPGRTGINWSVDRWSEGVWLGRENAWYACAPPTFGSLQLAPRDRFVDTLRLRFEPGVYRLRAFYRALTSPEALEGYRASSPSQQFTVLP